MLNLFEFNKCIHLLNNNQESQSGPEPLEIAMAMMTVIGAVLLLWFSLPLFINTIKTKDTSNQRYLMWIFYSLSSIFLLVPSLTNPIISFVSGINSDSDKVAMIPLFIIGIINIITLITGLTIIGLKIYNQKKAKQKGISEKEYCLLNNPQLKKDIKKINEI